MHNLTAVDFSPFELLLLSKTKKAYEFSYIEAFFTNRQLKMLKISKDIVAFRTRQSCLICIHTRFSFPETVEFWPIVGFIYSSQRSLLFVRNFGSLERLLKGTFCSFEIDYSLLKGNCGFLQWVYSLPWGVITLFKIAAR